MLFVVTYRKKHASSKTRKSFFAEHNEQPSVEQVQALVNSIKWRQFCGENDCISEMPGI